MGKVAQRWLTTTTAPATPSHEATEHVMQVLRDAPISYGQKYRHLVIEDLVQDGERMH